jgi:hypothetical protein
MAFGLARRELRPRVPLRPGEGDRSHLTGLEGLAALSLDALSSVLLAGKFLEGAWAVVVAVPLLMLLFARIQRYCTTVAREVGLGEVPPPLRRVTDSLVIVPVGQVSKVTQRALAAARALGHEVIAIAVHSDPAKARTARCSAAGLPSEPLAPTTARRRPSLLIVAHSSAYTDIHPRPIEGPESADASPRWRSSDAGRPILDGSVTAASTVPSGCAPDGRK